MSLAPFHLVPPDEPLLPSYPAATAELAARARAGDGSAFTALVGRLQPHVHRWALVLTTDPDEADDVMQEAFVQLFQRLHQWRGDASLEGWMYRIVQRVVGERGRTARRRAELARSSRARPERDVYLTDPGARVDREQAAAVVHELLGALPVKQREVFDLVDLQGYDPAEVAEITGAKPATVRANLFKARASLRARLVAAHPAAREIGR